MDVRYWSTFSSLIFHEGCHRLEVSGCHRTTLVLLRGIFCCCCFFSSYTVVFILLTSIRSDSIVFFFRPVVQICIWVILIKWSTLAMRNKRKEARSLMTSGSHTHTHTLVLPAAGRTHLSFSQSVAQKQVKEYLNAFVLLTISLSPGCQLRCFRIRKK